MYATFFGLKREPFSIAPDPRYLFMSERHREALAHLLYGVNGGGGFVLLSGEIGAGKTTVCRCFLEQVPKRCNVAYIFNPKLTVEELLRTVCDEFGVPHPGLAGGAATVKDYLDPLNEFLLKMHAVGRNSVLIIDEAQMLSAQVLEQLRLLTNLETNERKLLQIILIGQPELRDMLARPELEQLAQRVIARYHLGALSEAETQAYIRHRLAVAGLHGAMPFDAKALKRIHKLSRGVPRRINLLCDRALLGAYALGRAQVDRAITDTAAAEVFFKERIGAPARRLLGGRASRSLGVLAGAAIVGVAVGAGALWMNDAIRGTAPAMPSAGSGASAPAVLGSAAASAGGASRPAGAASSAAPSTRPSNGGAAAAAASAALATALSGDVDLAGAPPRASARSEQDAWRELAAAWNLTLAEGEACAAAQRIQVHCFRSPNSTLALIRQLDRPGIVVLHDTSDRAVHALLTGLTDRSATLRIGELTQSVSLASLARVWRGDFATLWRAPPSYAGKVVDANSGPIAAWLGEQLATLQGPAADAAPQGPASGPAGVAAWRARVAAFQLAQGLVPDGLAGPATFMQLNRAIGVAEPRLLASAPTAAR